jgi:hypothetical protein
MALEASRTYANVTVSRSILHRASVALLWNSSQLMCDAVHTLLGRGPMLSSPTVGIAGSSAYAAAASRLIVRPRSRAWTRRGSTGCGGTGRQRVEQVLQSFDGPLAADEAREHVGEILLG